MAGENVERHHEVYDAFNRGDTDAFLALMDDEVEWTPRSLEMEGGSAYKGHAGVARWRQEWHRIFPDWTAETAKVRDLGGPTLATLHLRGSGGESGTPVTQTIWHLAEWRAGKVVRLSAHESEAKALEVVGLRK